MTFKFGLRRKSQQQQELLNAMVVGNGNNSAGAATNTGLTGSTTNNNNTNKNSHEHLNSHQQHHHSNSKPENNPLPVIEKETLDMATTELSVDDDLLLPQQIVNRGRKYSNYMKALPEYISSHLIQNTSNLQLPKPIWHDQDYACKGIKPPPWNLDTFDHDHPIKTSDDDVFNLLGEYILKPNMPYPTSTSKWVEIYNDQWSTSDILKAREIYSTEIHFESRFESGNLSRVYLGLKNEYYLFLREDYNTHGHTHWFYFHMSNILTPSNVQLYLVNLSKKSGMYRFGHRPVVYTGNLNCLHHRHGQSHHHHSPNHSSSSLDEHHNPNSEYNSHHHQHHDGEHLRHCRPSNNQSDESNGGLVVEGHDPQQMIEEEPLEEQMSEDGSQSLSTPSDSSQLHRSKTSLENNQQHHTHPTQHHPHHQHQHIPPYHQKWIRSGKCLVGRSNYDEEVFGEYNRNYFTVKLDLELEEDVSSCFVAHSYPYTYSDLQKYIYDLITNNDYKDLLKHTIFSRSDLGNNMDILTITGKVNQPSDLHGRKGILLTARAHPGETHSSFIVKGVIDFLLSNDPEAKYLREHFVIRVIPMVNPDGVILGNHRCNYSGYDLNRQYKKRTNKKINAPEADAVKEMLGTYSMKRPLMFYGDIHGHNKKLGIFMYGCKHEDPKERYKEKLFPTLWSKRSPGHFSLKQCRFEIKKDKLGTSRIAFWSEFNIRNSFTIEASMSGYREKPFNQGTAVFWTVSSLQQLGREFVHNMYMYFHDGYHLGQRGMEEENVDTPTSVDDLYESDGSNSSSDDEELRSASSEHLEPPKFIPPPMEKKDPPPRKRSSTIPSNFRYVPVKKSPQPQERAPQMPNTILLEPNFDMRSFKNFLSTAKSSNNKSNSSFLSVAQLNQKTLSASSSTTSILSNCPSSSMLHCQGSTSIISGNAGVIISSSGNGCGNSAMGTVSGIMASNSSHRLSSPPGGRSSARRRAASMIASSGGHSSHSPSNIENKSDELQTRRNSPTSVVMGPGRISVHITSS